MNIRLHSLKLAIGLAGLALSSMTLAAPLLLYGGPTIDKASPACLNVGDAVSCSAGMLNVLNGMSPTQATTDAQKGYVFASPQGDLKDAIVIETGGNAATGNGDTDPTVGNVENGYKSNSGGDKYTATGKTGSTEGNLGDPANNGLRADGDAKGTWDIEIGWLLQALTIDSLRHELMIGFDYNQPQNGTGSLDYWALITVRDLDHHLGDINFEIKNTLQDGIAGNDTYDTYTSTKGFEDKPYASDFSTVNTVTCYKNEGGVVSDIIPVITGSCPQGYDTVFNAQSDSTTEIFAFLPELNASLESYLATGYDVISVRMLFGCFGGSDHKAGQGYLADEATGNMTTHCDGGGNADVYLLAGGAMDRELPEPGSLALAGLAMGALGWVTRRRRQG